MPGYPTNGLRKNVNFLMANNLATQHHPGGLLKCFFRIIDARKNILAILYSNIMSRVDALFLEHILFLLRVLCGDKKCGVVEHGAKARSKKKKRPLLN